MTAKMGPTERQSAGAAAGSDDSSKEQLRAAFKEFERTSQQSEPVEELHGSDDKLDQQLHAVLEEAFSRTLWRRMSQWRGMTIVRGSRLTSTTRLRSARRFMIVSSQ